MEIIFEINVPLGLQYITCADISSVNQFEDEREVLFDLDSVFELIGIIPDPEKNDRWIIRRNTSDHGGLLAAKYVVDSNQELAVESSESLFGKLLIDMDDADKAINYFHRLLTQSNENQQDIISYTILIEYDQLG